MFVYCACILYCTDLVSLVLECRISYLIILYIVLLIIYLVVNKGCLSPKLQVFSLLCGLVDPKTRMLEDA